MDDKLKDLAKEHADHSVNIEEKIEATVEIAEEIYREINEKVGKRGPIKELYGNFPKSRADLYDSRDNAYMGILCALTDRMEEAEEIYMKLCEMKKTEGIPEALLASSLGYENDSKEIAKKAMKRKEEHGLVNGNIIHGTTRHTAEFAIYYIVDGDLGKAKEYYDAIGEKCGKKGELYCRSVIHDNPDPSDNTLMLLLSTMLGCEERGILPALEETRKKSGNLFVWRSASSDMIDISENALVGIYHCLKAGKRLMK